MMYIGPNKLKMIESFIPVTELIGREFHESLNNPKSNEEKFYEKTSIAEMIAETCDMDPVKLFDWFNRYIIQEMIYGDNNVEAAANGLHAELVRWMAE